MKATTVSSWYVKLAGEVPARISQKMHWSLTGAKLKGYSSFVDESTGVTSWCGALLPIAGASS